MLFTQIFIVFSLFINSLFKKTNIKLNPMDGSIRIFGTIPLQLVRKIKTVIYINIIFLFTI